MKRTLSDFIRNATPEEKADVYAKVLTRATNKQLEAFKCKTCKDTGRVGFAMQHVCAFCRGPKSDL